MFKFCPKCQRLKWKLILNNEFGLEINNNKVHNFLNFLIYSLLRCLMSFFICTIVTFTSTFSVLNLGELKYLSHKSFLIHAVLIFQFLLTLCVLLLILILALSVFYGNLLEFFYLIQILIHLSKNFQF
jgi:hypothetical protein